MTPKRSTDNVYGAYLSGAVSLAETAALLRARTKDKPLVADSLELDHPPSDQREKAQVLLDELIGPACRRFIAGDITVDAAVDEIAPFLLPHGLFALNVGLADASPAAVPRFTELMARLIEVSDKPKSGDA